MVIVDVDGSSLSADSQGKSVGLVWGLAAIWRSILIQSTNRVNSRSVWQHHKHCNYLRQEAYVVVVVCSSVFSNFLWKLQTDLHEIFSEGWQWANEETVKFWWRFESPSGYRDCFPDSSLLGDTESGSAAASSHSFILIRQMAAVIIIKLVPISNRFARWQD